MADGLGKTNLKILRVNNAQFGEAGVKSLSEGLARLEGAQLVEIEMRDHDIRGPPIDPELMVALGEACAAQSIKFTWSRRWKETDEQKPDEELVDSSPAPL